jgi:hypothetical protein
MLDLWEVITMRLLSMSLPVIIGFSLACKGSVGKSSAKPASNSPATSEDPSAASDVATTVDVSAIVESGGNSLSLVANTVKVKVKRLGGEEVTTLDATLGSGGDFTAAVPADTFVVLQVEGGEGGLSTLIAPVGAADGADKAIPVNTESSIAAQMAETAVASAEAKELLDADGKLAFLDVVGLYESAKILVDDAIENGGKIDESALKALVGAFVAANVATVTELKQEGVAGAMLAEVFVKPAGKLMSAVKEAFASDGAGKLLSGALEKAEDAKSIDTLGKALANADEKAIGTLAAVVVKKAIKDAVKEARKSDKQMSDEDKQQLAALIAGQYAGADPSTLKKLADKSDAGFVNTVNAIKNATGGVGEALSQVLASLPPEVQAKVAEKQALEAAKAQGNGAIDGDELAKLMAEKCQALGGSYDPKASTPCTVPPAADAACKDPAQLWKSQDQASCTKLGGVWKTATKSVDECLKENGLALADDTCSDPGSYSYCETALLYASKSSCEQFCGAKWTASTEDSGGTGATADDTDMKLSLMLQSGSTKPVESCSFSNGPSGDQAATAPSQEVDEGEADSSDAADTDEGGSAIETEEPCSTVSLTDEVDFVTCKKGNLEQTCAAQFGELWKIGSWLDKETFCTWKR